MLTETETEVESSVWRSNVKNGQLLESEDSVVNFLETKDSVVNFFETLVLKKRLGEGNI